MIRWLAEAKHKNRKPEIIPNGELDKYCAMFILSIKKAGGGEYKPDSDIEVQLYCPLALYPNKQQDKHEQ
jgi:hypothetical protein